MPYVYYVPMGIALLVWLASLPYQYRMLMVLRWGVRANRLAVRGSSAEALDAYDAGLRHFRGHVGLLYGKGVALRKLGRDNEAATCYREVVRHHPRHYRAHYNLGTILRDMGRYDDAEREFLTAVEIRPDFSRAYCNLAILYDKAGKTEKAIEFYTKYFISGGNDPTVRKRARELGLSEPWLGSPN